VQQTDSGRRVGSRVSVDVICSRIEFI
jgi:hypothetical protein